MIALVSRANATKRPDGALVVLGFGLWEREDPLALGYEVLTTAGDWRAEEIAWQMKAGVADVGKLAFAAELRQGQRVIYAKRMYYDVRNEKGVVLDAEVLTPLPT